MSILGSSDTPIQAITSHLLKSIIIMLAVAYEYNMHYTYYTF